MADGNGNHPPETACAGPLELIAFISEPDVARRILDHLGLASQAPPLARAQAPDDQGDADEAPDYQAGDPTYDE